MKKLLLILVALLLLTGCFPKPAEPEAMGLPTVDEVREMGGEVMMKKEEPVEESVESMPPDTTPKDLPSVQASYEDYSSDRLAELKGSRTFALFFHATWCPSCRALEADILENMDQLGSAIILKADYDSESALKREYGVTVQDTVILFNADGSVESKKVYPKLDYIKDFFM